MTAPIPTAMNIKFKFPQFREIDPGVIEFAIEEAVLACNSTKWTSDADQTLAMTYYAAHLLQVSLMRATTGQVKSSERTPDLSVSYAVPSQDKPIDFTMTIYGERFMGLVQQNFPAVMVANSAVAF